MREGLHVVPCSQPDCPRRLAVFRTTPPPWLCPPHRRELNRRTAAAVTGSLLVPPLSEAEARAAAADRWFGERLAGQHRGEAPPD